MIETAEYFRLTQRDAGEVLGEVSGSVARWKDVALKAGLDWESIAQMEPAFEHEQARQARQMRHLL